MLWCVVVLRTGSKGGQSVIIYMCVEVGGGEGLTKAISNVYVSSFKNDRMSKW